MRITRMDIEGKPGNYATITRKTGSDQIEVSILTPEFPNGKKHTVQADCHEDVWSMAECLQYHLDGAQGTNSMIQDYYRELSRFAD